MDEILEHLKDGIRRFGKSVYPANAEHYRRVMQEPQRPRALIIACADSRVQLETLTQTLPGEIFVTRNIGNMVPMYGEMPGATAAVLEYAVTALGVPHVVVCGHSDCGAMKALIDPAGLEQMPAVDGWLKTAGAGLAGVAGSGDLNTLTEENVLLQMSHLRSYPAVAAALAQGRLTISGWVYDIAAGEVRICDGDSRDFVTVEAQTGR